MEKLKVLELFAGIGAPRTGMNLAGIKATFEAVEIDKYAVKSYNALYNENNVPISVVGFSPKQRPDIIFHGSPCQDFSQGGHGKGGAKGSGTRSSLLWESVRIITETLPSVVIWENVKRAKGFSEFEDYLTEMNNLGYTTVHKVLNSKDFGVPQNRERIFVISVRGRHYTDTIDNFFDKLEVKPYTPLAEFIKYKPTKPKTVDLSVCKRFKSYWSYPSKSGRINSGLCRASDPKMYSPTISTFQTREKIGIVKGNTLYFEPLNVFHKGKLMGFSNEQVYKMLKVNKESHVNKQLGNSIVVDVVKEIFEKLLNNKNDALNEHLHGSMKETKND